MNPTTTAALAAAHAVHIAAIAALDAAAVALRDAHVRCLDFSAGDDPASAAIAAAVGYGDAVAAYNAADKACYTAFAAQSDAVAAAGEDRL